MLGRVCLVRRFVLLVALLTMAGCQTTAPCGQRHVVDADLAGRGVVATTAVLSDGLTEDEAISEALARNAVFQATLSQLGIARGDILVAGQLMNPSFTTMLPLAAKDWEWTLFMPIEAFVTRRERVAMAESDYQRIAQQLVQSGLDLVRDVRVAFADFVLAAEQNKLAREAVVLRREIAEITQKRFADGAISELETANAQIDLLNAEAALALRQQEVVMARVRLATLLGQPDLVLDASAIAVTPLAVPALDVEALVADAETTRPDLQAAQWSVDAAARRCELAHWLFLRLDVGANANTNYEVGPALRFDLPLFHRNEGNIERANAEWEQACRQRDAIHDQIVRDVRVSAARVMQARKQRAILQQQVLPALEEAQKIATKSFDAGGTAYLLVLQTSSQYLDAKSRQLEQVAALRRSVAELERSVGRRVVRSMPLEVQR